MYRDRPEPREATVRLNVRVPRRLVDQLNRAAAARADIFMSHTAARDALVVAALDLALQPVAPTLALHTR